MSFTLQGGPPVEKLVKNSTKMICQISARRPDLIIINNKKKRTGRIVDFAAPANHKVKLKECEKRDKYFNLAREFKKLEHKSDNYINCNWCSWYSHQKIGTRTGELGNNGMGGDCPNYSIDEIGQNTEKSLGDSRRLVVIQTPGRNRQQALMRKTRKGVNNNNNYWMEKVIHWNLSKKQKFHHIPLHQMVYAQAGNCP